MMVSMRERRAGILAEIVEYKQQTLTDALMHRQRFLAQAAANRSKRRSFANALKANPPSIIAEIKKASPSKGLIRADFEPATLARAYHAGGASCLSVLTETPHFQGADAYLATAREACPLPALRKDFIVDRWQIYESRVLGADCILVILAAIEDDGLALDLVLEARDLEMAALVEVHDEEELDRALALPSPLIGINNRNLKTLAVDLATTERLAGRVTPDRILVCESGLYAHADLVRMQAVNANCFLVGESLMREADVTEATRRLLGEP